MSQSRFLLNPNAVPFMPRFKSTTSNSKEGDTDTKISEQDSLKGIHQIHGLKGRASQSEIGGIEKHVMEDVLKSSGTEKHNMVCDDEFAMEYLRSTFSAISSESIKEVYTLCFGNVDDTVNLLRLMEGLDDDADSLPIPHNSDGTADHASSESTSEGASKPSEGASKPSGSSESVLAFDE